MVSEVGISSLEFIFWVKFSAVRELDLVTEQNSPTQAEMGEKERIEAEKCAMSRMRFALR